METSINTQAKPKFFIKRQSTEAQKEAMKAKRAELKTLSNGIKLLVKEGKYDTINEGLIELYAKNGHTNLKTLRQWNEQNMSVKKGEKALLLWGTPKKTEKKDEQKGPDGEGKDMEFYPLCFVFSQSQVQPSAAK